MNLQELRNICEKAEIQDSTSYVDLYNKATFADKFSPQTVTLLLDIIEMQNEALKYYSIPDVQSGWRARDTLTKVTEKLGGLG